MVVVGRIFPPYRHIVVIGEKKFPTRIIKETFGSFETPVGMFVKSTGRKFLEPSIRFEGPFNEKGERE